MVEVAGGISPVEPALAESVVLETQEGIGVIVNLVSDEQIVLDEHVAGDAIGSQKSEGELVLSGNSPVVPGKVVLSVGIVINLDTVIRVADTAQMGSSDSDADVLQSLGSIDTGVEVPLAAPLLSHSVVQKHLQVIAGLDLGEQGAALGEVEPELGLVASGQAALILTDGCLEVDGALGALGIDLCHEELVVDEIVIDEGKGQAGEVGPGIHLD